ncbi:MULTISPECIES: glucosaminidase domain-containing protein [Giesbergeria]|uniref:Glucosaminidase domain-containing protein n=1 Tax=Giesbergeria sinuosa TaxID=80883 RepID=A0ABV9QCD9_9BURK
MARDLFAELGIEVRGSEGGDTKLSPEDAIKKVAQETGYNYDFLLGLSKLETRGGAATIKGDGVDTHNLFNIKDFSKDGTGIRATDKAEGSNHRYRQYADYEESVRDVVRLLDRKYPDARVAETSQEFAQALKSGGYATDPAYVNKLTRVIGSAQGGSNLSAGASQQAPGTAGRDVFAQLGIDRNRPAGGRDLFAEAGIDPKAPLDGGGRDLFVEAGIDPKAPMPGTALQKAGDYAGAVSSGIGTGVLGIQGGIGKFLQAPAANSLAAVAGGVALADRGVTWLANKLEGMDAKANPDIQQTAQMASQFAAEQRLENAKVGEDGGWANPMTMMARMGLGLQEDARSRTQAIMAADAATNPELLRQQQATAQAEGFVGNLKAIADNPMAFTHTMARSVPDMLMGVGMARLAAGGKLAAATNVGDAAAVGVAKAGGTAAAQAEAAAAAMAPLQQQAVARASSAGLLSEAASSGMNASEGIYQQVMGMPLDKLAASSDRYKELMAEVKNPYKARERLANELADQAALPSAVVTGLGTGITNKIFGGDATAKTVSGVDRMTGKELAKRVGQDTVEEVVQGVSEDTVQHGAVVQADQSAKLDVGGAIAQNAAAGLAMGGGMHGFAYGKQALGNGHAPSSGEQTSAPTPDTSPAPPEQATSSQENSSITDDAPISAAEQALKQPVALTALDRAVELDAELAHVRERLQDETPENGYGPAFDQSRQELAVKAAMLEQERNQIAATWPQAAKGAPTSFGTDSGVKLAGTYALMSADDLVTSHTEGLQPNPLYPQELQPRDRSRSASELQVSGIVQKLDPERLGASADAATGAPIVGMDGLVESGNARTIALKRVYQAKGQKAENYKAFLRDNAAQFGIDPAQVDVTPKPVLVRVRSTPVNRAEFARQANASTVQRMSPSEQAKADAARLNSLEGLNPTEDGDFSNSRDFIRQFRSTLPITEQSEMMEADGRLSAAGYRRIQNAVLAKAYGDSPTLRRMTESMDNNLLNISKALLRVAPTIASARERMEAGALHQADIAPDLVQAVEGLSALRDKGWTVAQELAQTDLTGPKYSPETAALMQFLADNMRSPRRIAEFFQRYYEALEQVGDPRQSSILGDVGPAPSRSDLLTQAREVTPNDNSNQDSQRGVDRESSLPDGQSREQSPDTQGDHRSPESDAAPRPHAAAGQPGAAEGQATVDSRREPVEAEKTPLGADTRLAIGVAGSVDGVPGVPLQDLQALADRLKARMPNMPKVNVLADPSSAPYSLMEYINRQDAWYDVQGAMHEGEFYLFGSGLQSLEQAEHVLAEHEAAHFGLRAVLGVEGLKSAMQMVWVHNASVRKQASKLQERGRLSDAEATEEVIVDIPTKELAQLKGWRKVVLKVRDFLDRRGYEKLADRLTTWLNGSLDEQQQADWFVADLVRAARDYVAGQRDGQPSGYVGATRLSRLKDSAASVSAPAAPSRAHGGRGFNEGSATVIGTFKNDIPMKAHPDYKAAKGGDLMAAAALVQDLVKPEDLQSAHEKFGSDVVFVPVHAEEAAGRNQIPNALAMMYAANSGAEVDTSIAQANRAFHTGAGAMERLLARAEFSGYVEPGRRYVLVDDVTTMGSTLADLAAYIQSSGGDVAGSVVLVNAMRGGKIQADRKTVNQLEARHGEVVRELFGFGSQ